MATKKLGKAGDQVSKAAVTVSFGGPAVQDGSMDLNELAPSMLALAGLVQRANTLVNDDRSKVRVRLAAGFKRGSFEFTIQVLQSLGQRLGNLLTHDNIQSADALLSILGLYVASKKGYKGALWLVKKLNNQKPDGVTIKGENVEINIAGDTFHVHQSAYELANDETFRRHAERFVRPLKREGVESVETRRPGRKTGEKITRSDVASFDQLAPDEAIEGSSVLHDGSSKQFFEIENAPFREGLVWRLIQGDDRITAYLLDEEFQQRIDDGERFAKGDKLEVDLRSVVRKQPDGSLDKRNEIVRVLSHARREQGDGQQSLLEDPDEG